MFYAVYASPFHFNSSYVFMYLKKKWCRFTVITAFKVSKNLSSQNLELTRIKGFLVLLL